MSAIRILAASALIAAGLVAASPAQADDERPRKVASCDYRICVYIVDLLKDSDGDGVTDIDEKYFATGVLDPKDTPTGPQLVDAVLERQLPSFEQHFTELVVLPQVAENRENLATALGSFPLPTRGDDDLSASLAALSKNGFTDILSGIGVSRPTAGASGIQLPGSMTTHFSYMQLVSSGEGTTVFSFPDFRTGSVNEGRTGGTTTTQSVDGKIGGLTTSVRGSEATSYADGSTDVTDFSGSTPTRSEGSTVTVTTGFTTHSVNATTGVSSTTVGTTTTTTDPKTGNSSSSTKANTTYKDKNGAMVGSSTTTAKSETKDGTTAGTSKTVYKDKDGNVIEEEPDEPHGEAEGHGGGRTDPDYVGVGPFSAADQARVIARLNSVRTPGPDTGVVLGDPPKTAPRDLYAYYSGDGVVTLTATPNPHFNIAQPEYAPGLRDLSPMAGVLPPDTTGNGGYGYWPDKP